MDVSFSSLFFWEGELALSLEIHVPEKEEIPNNCMRGRRAELELGV